jgi:hypothetical protein
VRQVRKARSLTAGLRQVPHGVHGLCDARGYRCVPAFV